MIPKYICNLLRIQIIHHFHYLQYLQMIYFNHLFPLPQLLPDRLYLHFILFHFFLFISFCSKETPKQKQKGKVNKKSNKKKTLKHTKIWSFSELVNYSWAQGLLQTAANTPSGMPLEEIGVLGQRWVIMSTYFSLCCHFIWFAIVQVLHLLSLSWELICGSVPLYLKDTILRVIHQLQLMESSCLFFIDP